MGILLLSDRVVLGGSGMSLAQLDALTVECARLLGGATSSPEVAADYLRDVYSDVLRTAGEVSLAIYRNAVEVAA